MNGAPTRLLVVFFSLSCSALASADPLPGPLAAPPHDQSITKWCKADSAEVLYANAGLAIPGYAPCGEVAAAKSCDPRGARMITPTPTTPSGIYKDCALGPRIYLEKDGRPMKLVHDAPASQREHSTTEKSTKRKKSASHSAAKDDQNPQLPGSLIEMLGKLNFGAAQNPAQGNKKQDQTAPSPFGNLLGGESKDLPQSILRMLGGSGKQP